MTQRIQILESARYAMYGIHVGLYSALDILLGAPPTEFSARKLFNSNSTITTQKTKKSTHHPF
jgi:hypothetical protein